MLSLWIVDQPYLGHKAPRPGRQRLFWCPACWTFAGPSAPLTSRHNSISYFLDGNSHLRHVMDTCPTVEGTRAALGIRAFLDDCLQAGRSRATAFKYYILGFDKSGDKIDLASHLQRGACLKDLTEVWLSTWENQANV